MTRFEPTGNLNQTRLLEAVLQETGRTSTEERVDTAQTLRALLDVIGRTMAAGYEVRLTNFGTFGQRERSWSRNPQTGQELGPVRVARFHANGLLRQSIKNGEAVTSLVKKGSPRGSRSV